MDSPQPAWTPGNESDTGHAMLQGKQAVAPHPEDVRINARYMTFPNETVERETLRDLDAAVFDRARVWEQYLVAEARQAREDAVVDTTAAQEAVDALSEVRWSLDRPLREVQDNMPALAARYRTLRTTAEKVIAALERADREEEARAAKLADPYADLTRLWDRWPMIRPVV